MSQSYTFSSGSGSRRERAHTPSRSASHRSHNSYLEGSEGWEDVGVEVEIEEEGEEDLEEEDEDEIDDGIEPEDSASRSRHTSASRTRYTTEAPVPPSRRGSSRHSIPREEPPPRRHASRRDYSNRPRRDSRRVPSDDSAPSSTVESHDDYPYSRHGGPPPRGYPPTGYRPVVPPPPGHGGYAPSVVNGRPANYPDPFAHAQAVVQRGHDPFAFGYNASNPFTPPDMHAGNPFSPLGSSSSASYFATDPLAPPMPHHPRPAGPPRPQSFAATHFAPDMLTPYGQPAYPGYPMPGYPPPGWGPYASSSQSPPLRDERDDPRIEELERLKAQLLAEKSKERDAKKQADFEANIAAMFHKEAEARMAWQKEMIAFTEAEAAAKAAAKAEEEAEKKRKEDIAAASKKAKEDAEKKADDDAKKAAEDADKKLKEAEKAKEEAEKKQKELEEEAKKLKPPPDHTLPPIKFKDAIGRKFSFPFHLCKTWKGMDNLIKSAFVPIDMISEHVQAGHYDLTGPDGEIILPQVWETIVKPDWDITMHMWPLPEPQPPPGGPMYEDDIFDINYDILGGGRPPKPRKGDKKPDKGKSKGKGPPMPPPPPDPLAGLMGGLDLDGGKHKSSSGKSKSKSGGSKENKVKLSWFAGGSAPRGAKRR